MKFRCLLGATFVAAVTLACNGTVLALGNDFSACCPDRFEPYVGIDLQGRSMGFKKDSVGDKIFQKNFFQGNVALGAKFHENYGVELGYEQTGRKKSHTTLNSGELNPVGDIVPVNETQTWVGKQRLKVFHINLMAYAPVDCYCQNLTLIGGIGVGRAQISADVTPTLIAGGQQETFETVNLTKNNKKWIWRLTGGAQYACTENFAIRGLLTYESTSALKPSGVSSSGREYNFRVKDSFIYGLGVIWKFC